MTSGKPRDTKVHLGFTRTILSVGVDVRQCTSTVHPKAIPCSLINFNHLIDLALKRGLDTPFVEMTVQLRET